MKNRIPLSNILFLLAYAFDLKWDYPKKEADSLEIEDLSFFELLVFVLLRWTEKLVKRGLYKTFIVKEEETKRLRGRVLFEPGLRTGKIYSDRLVCRFDDLSFDILENQILLSTLQFSFGELNKNQQGLTRERKKVRKEMILSTWNLIRLLSSQISYKPLSVRLFDQLLFHRMNMLYEPALRLCRFIYDSAVLRQPGEKEFWDIPDSKMSEVFERFLRSYLAESLVKEGYRVDKGGALSWVLPVDERERALYIPGIHPDIIIWEKGRPKFIIDAKFYKRPVYQVDAGYSEEVADEKPKTYKTHSHNLYQLIAYTDYFNCSGILVYVQTQTGFFHEMVRLNPKYYSDQDLCFRRFGFRTLDLAGEVEDLRERMKGLVGEIQALVKEE